MPSPVLAAYLGPDPSVARYLARMARSLRQVDIVDQRALKPGHGAEIVIVDCRLSRHHEAKLAEAVSPGLMQLALVPEGDLYRAGIFAAGYFDYLLWPLIEQEVLSRLRACVAEVERRSAASFFSVDPIVQRSCDLLAHRIEHQVSLSELARLVGTNRTTLVDRFEASFGCGPMTWLRHYRMVEAAMRLRSSHQSIAEIARTVGYENSNNFATSFKAIHGLSPLRYRKMAVRREKPV